MLICSFCLFTHRAVRFLSLKSFRERKLSKDCILPTSHILNGTIQHKVQKRVKSFQDTTCYWRPHRKQWLRPKQGIQQHKTAWKVHSVFQPLFPPSGKPKQMRPEILNSVLFINGKYTKALLHQIKTYRLFNQFFRMFFNTLTFLLSANFKGILRILLCNKSCKEKKRQLQNDINILNDRLWLKMQQDHILSSFLGNPIFQVPSWHIISLA